MEKAKVCTGDFKKRFLLSDYERPQNSKMKQEVLYITADFLIFIYTNTWGVKNTVLLKIFCFGRKRIRLAIKL
jgi:hypothetical protein